MGCEGGRRAKEHGCSRRAHRRKRWTRKASGEREKKRSERNRREEKINNIIYGHFIIFVYYFEKLFYQKFQKENLSIMSGAARGAKAEKIYSASEIELYQPKPYFGISNGNDNQVSCGYWVFCIS